MKDNNSTKYNGKIAFFYKGSWYHRKKELLADGSVKYGRVGGFNTPKEAEENYFKCLELFEQKQKEQLIPIIDKEIMLSDYLIYWFENLYSKHVESTTNMITSFTLYYLILPNLPYNIKLRLTTTEYVDSLLEKVNKISKTAANKARETLMIAMKNAVKDSIITINPVEMTKKYRRSKTNVKILNKSELKRFLEFASTGNWYLELLLAVFMGLRKSEILGLKFSDFNMELNTLKISRQLSVKYELVPNKYNIKNREYIEKEPKTENSYRTLRVPKIIIKELDVRRKQIEKDKKLHLDYSDKDYISCQSNGLPHSPSSLNSYLKKLCLRASLPCISVHSLRHVYATILIEQGVTLPKISALLGHSSIHTTFEWYCDIIEENEKITAFMNNTFSIDEGEKWK